MSIILNTTKIFENVRVSRISCHAIGCNPINGIVRTVSQYFQMLDPSDPIQSDLARRLWLFRSSILFTLLPFSSSSLGLELQLQELAHASIGFPGAGPHINKLQQSVAALIESGKNPKYDWLQGELEKGGQQNTCTALLYKVTSGRVPGWPDGASSLGSATNGLILLGALKDFRSGIFDRIILPCACKSISQTFLQEIVHSGRSASIDVLLYPSEHFQVPRRLQLPQTPAFKRFIQKTVSEHRNFEVPEAQGIEAVDDWASEAFWQGVHGASRGDGSNLVAANYVIFSDGTGTFLPANGRVPVIPEAPLANNANDIRLVPVEGIDEGDVIVLRTGDSDFLLDEASNRLMTDSHREMLFEEATDWKEALDALLITHSAEEVSDALKANGAIATPASIHHWVGTDVLGPGSELVFKELITFLAEKKKISKEGKELEEYTNGRWGALQELRGIRHRAGNLIRQDLLKELSEKMSRNSGRIIENTSIRLDGNSDVELLLLKVSGVDQRQAFISPNRLCKQENLKGNKWLG